MKINGKSPGVFEHPVVIPRPDGNFVFICKAIMSYEEFDKLCPRPRGKQRTYPDGRVEEAPPDKASLEAYAARKTQWAFIKSIGDTPGLTWDKVDPTDPNTWQHVDQELTDAGLNTFEIMRISQGVATANSLNEDAIKAATDSYLASLRPDTAD